MLLAIPGSRLSTRLIDHIRKPGPGLKRLWIFF